MAEEKKNGKLQGKSNEAKENREESEKKQEETPAELKERLIRLAAEFDNYKKRVMKDIDSSKDMGKAELVKRILPALDEFELALRAMENEKSNSKMGVELVYTNLVDALGREGLKAIEVGEKFDPYQHEIMLTKESERSAGTVLEVVRKGYTFNGIMLRPASVIVAKERQGGEQKNKK